MTIVIIIAAIWGTSALIRAAKEKKRQREIERINAENRQRAAEAARMREEMRQQQAEARAWTRRQVELEREQQRQAKEIAKHEEQLAKHEKRIADLEYRATQAEADISFLQDRIASPDAQRDYLLLQQSGTVPGGKEHTKYQTKIISLDNQIHSAEAKLAKAQHTRTMAEKELSA